MCCKTFSICQNYFVIQWSISSHNKKTGSVCTLPFPLSNMFHSFRYLNYSNTALHHNNNIYFFYSPLNIKWDRCKLIQGFIFFDCHVEDREYDEGPLTTLFENCWISDCPLKVKVINHFCLEKFQILMLLKWKVE